MNEKTPMSCYKAAKQPNESGKKHAKKISTHTTSLKTHDYLLPLTKLQKCEDIYSYLLPLTY